MTQNILAVITARGGSKGLPGKNIKELGGKPLIVWSIAVAQKSQLITDLIVSTDYEDIAEICRKNGAEVPFLRPAELASDTSGHVEVMRHAIDFMEKKRGMVYDYAVILQPTSPFRLVEDIDVTLEKLIASGADSAVTVYEVSGGEHPIKAKKLEGDRILPYCLSEPEGIRRQDLAPAYKRSSAVYAMKRSLLMEQGKLYGEHIIGHIVPKDRSIDIDDPYDWLKAEYMLGKLQEKGLFL